MFLAHFSHHLCLTLPCLPGDSASRTFFIRYTLNCIAHLLKTHQSLPIVPGETRHPYSVLQGPMGTNPPLFPALSVILTCLPHTAPCARGPQPPACLEKAGFSLRLPHIWSPCPHPCSHDSPCKLTSFFGA